MAAPAMPKPIPPRLRVFSFLTSPYEITPSPIPTMMNPMGAVDSAVSCPTPWGVGRWADAGNARLNDGSSQGSVPLAHSTAFTVPGGAWAVPASGMTTWAEILFPSLSKKAISNGSSTPRE